jgi:hypothetical protein
MLTSTVPESVSAQRPVGHSMIRPVSGGVAAAVAVWVGLTPSAVGVPAASDADPVRAAEDAGPGPAAGDADRDPTAGEADPAIATLACEHATIPGRVRCVVEARVVEGESISWGDVILVVVPPFLRALRGRIGPHDATAQETSHWRWELALVAGAVGRGVVEGRVRLVVCHGASCLPRQLPIAGTVLVGDEPHG